MQQVFVLDNNRQPLMPCHPARARELLKRQKAAVFRKHPFTIILKDREGGEAQPVELKVDPGSRVTGLSLVADCKRGKKVVWAGNLSHRGIRIKKLLDTRRMLRRSRRSRKTRYRKPRFNNRTRPAGWLPPSLHSRVNNVLTWGRRLQRLAPLTSVAVETVRFDMQLIENPEISGVEYQQGTLAGYELREYLLEKWDRTCAYCGKTDTPLQVEHIVPRAKGGTNRISNLTLACEPCNTAKGTQDIRSFLANHPERLRKILAQARRPLRDAAAVNATRYATGNALKLLGLPVTFWSGGRTKANRLRQNYPKDHWVDAACVGESGERVYLPEGIRPASITANGRGSRLMCRPDKYGFPRTKSKGARRVKGFATGDIVKAVVVAGRKAGTYVGRVAVRATGSFNIKTEAATIQGIGWRHCRMLHKADGYSYA
jgi:5-methylcytosine-specific restriction endonuclease McrA